MSEIISGDILSSHYNPSAMLVVYKNGNDHTYLEVRPIDKKGVPGAAKPVSQGFVSDMLQHFSSSVALTPHGPVPSNMLYADTRPGQERYIWWEGPKNRMQYFTKSLGLEDGMYPMPGVIYCVNGSSLHVYAFAGRKPGRNATLLEGPFFNVSRGSVCLGSAKTDKPSDLTWEALQQYWQKLFWGSVNVHLGTNPIRESKDIPGGGNLVLVLKDCLGKDSFDTNILKPIRGLTLSNLLKK